MTIKKYLHVRFEKKVINRMIYYLFFHFTFEYILAHAQVKKF